MKNHNTGNIATLNAARVAKASLSRDPPSRAELKVRTILMKLLSDGNERTSTEVHDYVRQHGGTKKHTGPACKALGIEMNGGGRQGPVLYRLVGATTQYKDANPEVVRSVEILSKKAGEPADDLRSKLEHAVPGYDPLVAMAQIANDLSVPLAIRLEIHQTLSKYLVPQVKAAAITTNDQPLALNFRWKT